MAETAGLVTGVLGVAGLFNNCVECFEYIQLSRHFGQDFERCQLKLDVARVLLTRWGDAVGINTNGRFKAIQPNDSEVKEAEAILEEIDALFHSVQKKSKRYELKASQEQRKTYQDDDFSPVFGGLHNRFRSIAQQRQKRTGLLKKAAWALYDGKSLAALVNDIKGFVEDLEKLFPIETACRQLADVEIEEIDDEASLQALHSAAADTDKDLSDAVVNKLKVMAARNYVGSLQSDKSAAVVVGSSCSDAMLSSGLGVLQQTTNEVNSIAASDDSVVQVGNRYGGRDLFENRFRD
jgi:hypothetical protein